MAGASPRIVIIGSGFAGLGAAIKLREAGCDDLVILERAGAVGGTWRDNTYPGAACDIPAHLYSFSFAPKADWAHAYPRQPEIRDYLEQLVDDHGLGPHIELGAEVVAAEFDEATATWRVTTADGRERIAEVVIGALGPLSDPAVPDLPGRKSFAGPQFHSAKWDHDVDLENKRVGVVGTGASCIQFVPHVADAASAVTVFQRSAPWVIPRYDRRYTDTEKRLFARVPGLRALYRWLIYWQKECRFVGFKKDSKAMGLMERYARWNMRRAIGDPQLREVLTPDYRMGCKRILISNDYYPALARDHVEVVTDPISAITPSGVRTRSGRETELDVLVWGTGFRVADPLGPARITGVGGHGLHDVWAAHPSAYLGTTVPGFPNLFLLLGPNTGLGHNSMIYMMEAQFPYIVDAVTRLRDRGLAYLDVEGAAHEAFQDEVDRRNRETVWASGCDSWYLKDGHNFSLWPGYTFEYRRRTREFDAEHYHEVRREQLPSPKGASTAGV